MALRLQNDGREDTVMIRYALLFLIVGLVATVLGVTGVDRVASQIGWVVCVVGISLLVVHVISGRLAIP